MSQRPQASLMQGVIYGISTNVLSALAFIIPQQLTYFSSIQITLGRYMSYGLISLCIMLVSARFQMRGIRRQAWWTSVLLAITGNIGYYFFLVLGIQHVGASVAALINGILPITVAWYGNWRRREFPWSRLLLPSLVTALGLLVINLSTFTTHPELPGRTGGERLLGVVLVGIAVLLWTWYAVATTNYLRQHPQLSSSTWSTMIGVSTLLLMLLALPFLQANGYASWNPEVFLGSGNQLLAFVIGSCILGVIVSWGGTILWNRALISLPVSVAGQFIVFEPITVLIYVSLVQSQLPGFLELAGALLISVGVIWSLHTTRRREKVAASMFADGQPGHPCEPSSTPK